MFSFKSVYFVVFNLVLCQAQTEISDKRLCVDANCSELIAIGKTLIRYSSPGENFLSFGPNENVKIFSYGAGKRPDLIGVELKGKRGYINKNHIIETSLIKRPKLLINTEIVLSEPNVPFEPALEGAANNIKADVTQEAYEVVDGTKIPLDLVGISTEGPVHDIDDKEGEVIITKPLDSVPENLNINEPAKSPIEIIDDNLKKVETENKVEEEKEVNDSDDENDDTDDEDDDEQDSDNEEEDSEETDIKLSEEADVKNSSLAVEESFHNITIDSDFELVNEDIPKEEPEKINNVVLEGAASQVSHHNEPIENLDKPENVTKSTAPPNITETNLQPETNSVQNAQKTDSLVMESEDQTDLNISANEPLIPVADSNIAPPIIQSTLEDQTDGIFVSAENTQANNAEETKEADANHQTPTTEIPIEVEVLPPLDDSPATPNPLSPEEIAAPETTDNNQDEDVKEDVMSIAEENDAETTPEHSEYSRGFISGIKTFFGLEREAAEERSEDFNVVSSSSDFVPAQDEVCDIKSEECPQIAKRGVCDKEIEDCPDVKIMLPLKENFTKSPNFVDIQKLVIQAFSSDMFLYLSTTSLSVLILIFVWILLDKFRREGPLIARINKLEQQLLATSKENEMLHEKATLFVEEKTQLVVETVPNEVVDELNAKLADMAEVKLGLEEQIQALEKELDTSTEVGIELNKIISEMLNSTDGSEILKENVEQMQKKLLEQQDTINSLNDVLDRNKTDNLGMRFEVEISNKKVADLQSEVDNMVERILRIEEERDKQQKNLENEITLYQNKCKETLTQEHLLRGEIAVLNKKVAELQRLADTKIKEYVTLKETIKTVKNIKNDKETLKSFLDVSEVKAQLEQLKSENLKYSDQLSREREANISYTTQIQTLSLEVKELRDKYEKADKQKVEINTKLEVLNNYFKEKEDQMQKEISKYESLWAVKEGEATSTTERIRYMQEELQNYKAQNESLKQEIVNQEVELKSQISMLEKKSHESWVTNRQTERKLEEARQEAALLRNRLTMRERALAEGHNQLRMQSPLHQNGELPISPPPLDPTQSPPPLFNPRDHMTKSPPIPGLPPPPFLPPPLGGAPFIPPPPLDGMMPPPIGDIGGIHPPFIPGLHSGMFPGDHRPPPLGRMSSPPPVGGRYTPESTVYSEYDRYDRRSPSPPYDSEYGASPPPIRGYSPYDDRDRDRLRDDRREYKRPQPRSNGRNSKRGVHSSGSENDSLGKINKNPQRKV